MGIGISAISSQNSFFPVISVNKKSSDNATGLALSARLDSAISALSQARSNAAGGQLLLKTVDSALNSVSNLLLKAKHSAVQSANSSTLSSSDRQVINKEFGAFIDEITRVADSANRNSSSGASNAIQPGLDNIDISTHENALNSINVIDKAVDQLVLIKAGAVKNRPSSAASNRHSALVNKTSFDSNISDANIRSEVSKFKQDLIIQNSAIQSIKPVNLNNNNLIGQVINTEA